MSNPYVIFVGIDLGSESHQVCVLDADGNILGRRRVEQSGAALGELIGWLAERIAKTAAQSVAVALEAPRGAIIDALLERGHALFSINPKQLDRFRDRYSVAGAKDDARDAYVLAASLRTDRVHYRALKPDHRLLIRLRELSRTESALQQDFRRSANQLWSYLQRYFPGLLRLAPAADELGLFDLLQQTQALPAQAARLSVKRLQNLLRARRIRRFSAPDLHQQLQQPLPLAPGVEQALAEQVLLLLPRLRLLHQQLSDLADRIDHLLEEMAQPENFPEHRSVEILLSIPGVGRVFTATVLSEATTPLLERDYHALRALAGVAPVTQQSGKTKLVSMRRACNARLRNAVVRSSGVHIQADTRAKQIYARLRCKGNSHSRALRGVGDRLLHLICVLLNSDQLYDPNRREPTHTAVA